MNSINTSIIDNNLSFKRMFRMNKEVTFSQYAVGVFMAASISLGGYVAHSIATLNERMATVVEKLYHSEVRLDHHDEVIDTLRSDCAGLTSRRR